MRLGLAYTHNAKIGYGRMGSKLHQALTRAGVEVFDDIDEPAEAYGSEESYRYARSYMGDGQHRGVARDVCHVTFPSHVRGQYEGQRLHAFSMYETSRLPEEFRDRFDAFETMIVPSEQNVELFSPYHDNVHLVPLGVDPADWHFTPRVDPRPVFRFLCGGTGARKGTDLAFKAFQTVFPHWEEMDPVPEMVFKNPRGENLHAPWSRMVTGFLDDDEERALYARCHVYVQPSRGEGFGLQPLQAIAQGMPTILTDAHGHAGFAHLGIGIPATHVPAGQFIHGHSGDWWEPDFEALCEAMHDTYHNYDAHAVHARASAETVTRDWTWDHTAHGLLHALPALTDDLVTSRVWQPVDRRLFRVVVNDENRFELNGVHYRMLPGVDYYEPADVKRMLFEANRLAVSCLDDPGLSESQVARIDAYKAEHSYCPTCRQRLNTLPTRSDDLFEEATAQALIAGAGG